MQWQWVLVLLVCNAIFKATSKDVTTCLTTMEDPGACCRGTACSPESPMTYSEALLFGVEKLFSDPEMRTRILDQWTCKEVDRVANRNDER